jgi:hypothetical protein
MPTRLGILGMNEIVGRQEQFRSLAETSEPASRPPQRRAVLVLGMHRSGTSALAGVINALGVAVPKKTLMGGDNWNQRGFFESYAVAGGLNELLASVGSHWHDWRRFDPEWIHSKAAEDYRRKIKAIFMDEFDDEPFIVVKDPRICRFVPFIESILADLNFAPVAVLPLRHPLEVAYSLRRRDQLALSKSILLWLRYVLDAEFYSRHMPRCLLRYEDLLTDWRHCVNRMAEETGIVWPNHAERSGTKIEQFLTSDLRHERGDDIGGHTDLMPLARDTYEILSKIAAGGENGDSLGQLDAIREKFNDGCQTFGAAVAEGTAADARLIVEYDALTISRNSLIAERDSLAATRDSVLIQQEKLAREHDQLLAEHAVLVGENKKLLAARDAMLGSRSWRVTAPLRYVRNLFARRARRP